MVNNLLNMTPSRFTICFLSLVCRVTCFSHKTHEYLGEVTEKYLEKFDSDLYAKVQMEVDDMPLSQVSIWADKIKKRPEYQWTKKLHYIDILECNTTIDRDIIAKYCSGNCITSAILSNVHYLHKNSYVSDTTCSANFFAIQLSRKERLMFLMHFLQDFSQPLHLIGYHRGGNSYTLIRNKAGHNRSTNLHYLWDSEIPSYYTSKNVWELEEIELREFKNIDEYYEFFLEILNQNTNVACDYIYGKHGDEKYIIFEDYFNESYQRLLFQNYLTIVINTLRFVYNYG